VAVPVLAFTFCVKLKLFITGGGGKKVLKQPTPCFPQGVKKVEKKAFGV
jgi:hypothetical protein